MATRDYLVLYLNGQRREVRGGDCFLSLSDYLRVVAGWWGQKLSVPKAIVGRVPC